MKKFSKIHSVIIAALMLSAVPAHGMQEEESRMQQVGQKGAQYAATTRDYLIQEFNESVDRLKRCVTFQSCSKKDALKMGRDLLILLVAVYSAKEARKGALRRWGKRTPPPTLPPFKTGDLVAYKRAPKSRFKILFANENQVFIDQFLSEEEAHLLSQEEAHEILDRKYY